MSSSVPQFESIPFDPRIEQDSDIVPPTTIVVDRDPEVVRGFVESAKPPNTRSIVSRVREYSFGVDPETDLDELLAQREQLLPLLQERFLERPTVDDGRLLVALGDFHAFGWAVEQFRANPSSPGFLPLVFLAAGWERVLQVNGLDQEIVRAMAADQWPAIKCAVKLQLSGVEEKYLDLLEELPAEERDHPADSLRFLEPSERGFRLLDETLVSADEAYSNFEEVLATYLTASDPDLREKARELFEILILQDGYYSRGSIAAKYLDSCDRLSVPFILEGIEREILPSYWAIPALVRLLGPDAMPELKRLIPSPDYGCCAARACGQLAAGSQDHELDLLLKERLEMPSEKHPTDTATALLRNNYPGVRDYLQPWIEQGLDSDPEERMDLLWEWEGISFEHAREILADWAYHSPSEKQDSEAERVFGGLLDLFRDCGICVTLEVDGGECGMDDLVSGLNVLAGLSGGRFQVEAAGALQDEAGAYITHKFVSKSALYSFTVKNSHSFFDPYLLIDILNYILEHQGESLRYVAMPSDMFQEAHILCADKHKLRTLQDRLKLPLVPGCDRVLN